MSELSFFFLCFFLNCRYEVNFQDGIDCGGAYIKLLSDSGSLSLVGICVLYSLKFMYYHFRNVHFLRVLACSSYWMYCLT